MVTDSSLEKRKFDTGRLIARFNAAAPGYDAVADLQKYVGEQLLERMEMMRIKPERILDLGSGTGIFSRTLARNYPATKVIELDIAEKMLATSRSRARRFFSRQQYVCAEAERVPLSPVSVDMVFSNLMLQWSHDYDKLFSEIFRVLDRNGLFIFSTFGPDTLRELRESWALVDDYVHVNPFEDMHNLGDALVRAGFADPVMESDCVRVDYPDVHALMKDLKGLGAQNVNLGRRPSLLGKDRFRKMLKAYEDFREQGRLPATYEVIYGHAWMPSVHSRRGAGGTVTVPVDVLRKSKHRRP